MLTQAYTAMQQLKRQFSDIHSIDQLKALLEKLHLKLSINISSATVWILDWDVSGDEISGTLDLKIEPTFSVGDEILKIHQRSFLLQEPNAKGLVSLEKQLIEFIREDIKNMD
jgi:hypothetical protein